MFADRVTLSGSCGERRVGTEHIHVYRKTVDIATLSYAMYKQWQEKCTCNALYEFCKCGAKPTKRKRSTSPESGDCVESKSFF